MLKLRDYQKRALANVEKAEAEGVQRPLVVHPTGTGKTVTFAGAIAQRAVRGRTVVLVHRDELARQTMEKLAWQAPELKTGVVKAGEDDVHADVVIASIQTVSRPARLARLLESQTIAGRIATIVVDEAHHAPAPTWTRVIRALGGFDAGGPLVIGFTATPERDNGKKLGVWDKVVDFMSIREAIHLGHLVPILPALVVETKMDMRSIRKTGGDFSEGDLGREMDRSGAVDQIADAYVAHARDRKAVAFTPTVATAHALADSLVARGVPAEALSGSTDPDERKAILSRLKTGETWVVVNCAVLTEGFDEPTISCVIVARPTKFHGLYVQMIGRGTRLAPGKQNLLIMDVVGATRRHEMVGVVDLGLDLDGEQRKKKGEPEKLACGTCEVPCDLPEHRCRLCGRYLPASVVADAGTRHDNCRAAVGGRVDVFGQSKLRWLPAGKAWCLGAGQETVIMAPLKDGNWHLLKHDGEGTATLYPSISMEGAMAIGEDRAKAFVKLADRKARWLKNPMTDAQKARLIREGLPEPNLVKLKTRGEAADLITRIVARRVLKKVGAWSG